MQSPEQGGLPGGPGPSIAPQPVSVPSNASPVKGTVGSVQSDQQTLLDDKVIFAVLTSFQPVKISRHCMKKSQPGTVNTVSDL